MMPTRLEFERAIRRSSLLPPSRHLALTIATWADVASGIIPQRFQPSLSTLTEATGLDRSTVRRHLTRLEAEGWLKRERPDPHLARTQHARTGYVLAVPIPIDLDAEARGTEPLGLGAHSPQPGGTEPLGLGAENTRARGTQPLKSALSAQEFQKYQLPGETAPEAAIPDGFDAFWSEYPIKKAKQAALKAWKAAMKRGVTPEHITKAAAAYAIERRGQDARYTKHPATWLNAASYDDEPTPDAQSAGITWTAKDFHDDHFG